MLARPIPRLRARGCAGVGKHQQCSHRFDREAQFASASHERQSSHVRRAIGAMSTTAQRHWKHADALIIANRLDVAASALRDRLC